jgi:hypothetical protein
MSSLAGFVRVCGLMSGGIKRLDLIAVDDLTSMTATQKVYTAITLASGKYWKTYEFEPDTCVLDSESTVENGAIKYHHEITFHVRKMSTTGRAMVEEITGQSGCGIIAVAEDNNGTKWVLGYTENHLKLRPLQLKGIKSTTGKALVDANGYDVTLWNENNEPPYTTSAAIVTGA